MSYTDLNLLDILLHDWREQLRVWAQNGTITLAAQHALQLEGEPEMLRELVAGWREDDFSNLPPVVLLPASAMPGAAGAYAISTGTIYLNQDWLVTVSHERAIAVLTEELGHHLDGLLNEVDTDGDEGQRFSLLLVSQFNGDYMQPFGLAVGEDFAFLGINGRMLLVMQSSLAGFGINLGTSNYSSNKFSYTTASTGFFQCTTYAFGRALELGLYSANLSLLNKIRNDGGKWDDNVGVGSYTRVASAQSFIVWDPYTGGTGAEGHVGFVEEIRQDGSLVISEANYRKQSRNPTLAWSSEIISPGTSRYNSAKFIPLAGGASTPPLQPPPQSIDNRLKIPIFDPAFYLATYADIRNAYGSSNHDGARSHWLQYGINEGRRGSLVFDPKYSLQRYQDVANAYGATYYAGAISHWLEWGLKYGRRGSQEFDPIYYMAAHPDVEQAYGVMNFKGAISHYYQWGKPGGWYGSEWITDDHAFQLWYYLNNNADVKAVTANANQEVEATRHWYFIGINEGRRGSPELDSKFYLANYADVRTAYGDGNYRGVVDHYLLFWQIDWTNWGK